MRHQLLRRLAAGSALLLSTAYAQAPQPAAPAAAPQFSAGMERFDQRSGEALYRNICQACHMPEGRGAADGAAAYPALAANPHLASKLEVLNVIVNGRRAMPAWGAMLDDRQVAAVANYVRSHFGNAYADSASPREVAPLRPRHLSPNSYEQ